MTYNPKIIETVSIASDLPPRLQAQFATLRRNLDRRIVLGVPHADLARIVSSFGKRSRNEH